jgi:hypothetical protein
MTVGLPRWAWVGALAASFLIGLTYHLPLRVALRWAGASAVVERAALDGSITRWQARLADGIEVRFVADPLVLLSGRYGGHLEATRGSTRLTGVVIRGWDGGIGLRSGELAAGLAPLAATLGMPASMLEGQLKVTAIAATWRQGALVDLACDGEVSGVRGGSGADALALGDLGIRCATEAGGPSVEVEDRGGPLAFHAELRFAADGRFLLAGTAGARPGAPPALAQVLPMLGRSSGPDQVSFKYAGALPAF